MLEESVERVEGVVPDPHKFGERIADDPDERGVVGKENGVEATPTRTAASGFNSLIQYFGKHSHSFHSLKRYMVTAGRGKWMNFPLM